MLKKMNMLMVLVACPVWAMAEESSTSTFPGEVSGNIAVLSSYNLRGITNSPENNKATLQAGIEYSHSSGFYAGYWGSTLGYSLTNKNVQGEYTGRDSFENDFSVGYKGEINQDLSYQIGGIYYYYYESDAKSDFLETQLGLNYKDLSLSALTATRNVNAANTGDTYLLASYSYELPKDFTANIALGAYYYNKNKNLETKNSFDFRHLTLGVSHPLGNTGASMNIDYIIGGYDRMEVKQKNKVALGLSYSF